MRPKHPLRAGVAFLAMVALAALPLPLPATGAATPHPSPSGSLTIRGSLSVGSTVRATGVTWKHVPRTFPTVSFRWSACIGTKCSALGIPSHQPYLATALLGPSDVGRRLRVTETATDVTTGATTYATSLTFETQASIHPWRAGTPPRVDFINGLPDAMTTSNREEFDLSPALSNTVNGSVSITCWVDARRPVGCRGGYLTPVLATGGHTMHVRASNRAGSTVTTFQWKVGAMPAPTTCTPCFHPPVLATNGEPMAWDWQLQPGPSAPSTPGGLTYRSVDMFDVDGLTNSANGVVAAIHARAGPTLTSEKAICYLSLGSWEDFRPDEASWPKAALGDTLGGYAQEHWVDVRQLTSLLPVIDSRMSSCARAGFDGVEVDNINGWETRTGFPLTPQDTEAWLAAVANAAHADHLFILWKNDPDLASMGVRYFDGALSEHCFTYGECTAAEETGQSIFPGLTCNTTTFKCGLTQFKAAGKFVGEVEYQWGTATGVVCSPTQSCTLKKANGDYTEVPFTTFCADVQTGLGFAAFRSSQSNLLNGTDTYDCWT